MLTFVDACTFALTRTHTCHNDPKVKVIGSVPLRNVAPSKSLISLLPIHQIGFGSQEPRRPRFSFFHLHNVKEQTPEPGGTRRRWKHRLPNFGNRRVLPVARQHLCPFLILAETAAPQGVPHQRWAGYMADLLRCQHPKMTKPTFSSVGPIRGHFPGPQRCRSPVRAVLK